VELKFKRITIGSRLPDYRQEGNGGLDLTVASRSIGLNFVEYGFGVAVEIPVGYVGFLVPKASISDTNLYLANSVGIIDSNFKGELKARFKRDGGSPKFPSIGDKIVQLVVLPIPQMEPSWVENLTHSEREALENKEE